MKSATLRISINVSAQRLDLERDGEVIESFPVSTSAFGLGAEPGSLKTPHGRFSICEKIGHGAPLHAVFKNRLPTGEFGTEEHPDDFVQTRILQLAGLEEHNANTFDRYIYIHGTNHERDIGTPASHGCIRMRNADVARLFNAVEPGTQVEIQP